MNVGDERDIDVTLGGAVIPLTAFAALLNLTVTQTGGTGGGLSVRETGTPFSGTSSINWFGTNQDIGNNCTSSFDVNGHVTVHAFGTGPTHFVVDVVGFYTLTA